jgi:hypothetical protein
MSDFSKKQIFISEKNINITNLTIRLKSNGFVLCGFDPNEDLLLIEELNFLKGNIETSRKFETLSTEYQSEINLSKINFIYPTDYFTLVPKQYFEENHLKSYFLHAISTKDLPSYTFNHSSISHETICISAIEKCVYDAIKNAFPNSVLSSETELMMNACSEDFLKRIIDKKTFLYLNFLQHKCDIIEFADGKLILANRISFNTIENFIYHVLNTLHQSGQFTELTEVILLGDIEKQSGIVLGLSRYFNRIHFLQTKFSGLPENASHNFIIETFIK